jgi:hypothetical protein
MKESETTPDPLWATLKIMTEEQREVWFSLFRVQGICSDIENAWRQQNG